MYDAFSKTVDSRPAIIFIHGGGWIGGSAGKIMPPKMFSYRKDIFIMLYDLAKFMFFRFFGGEGWC